MRSLHVPIVALFVLSPLPAASQQSADKTAGETVVVPGWPGTSGNREIRIGGQEIVNSQVTGPEFSVTAKVVQWEEGRSITVVLPNGETRVVPVPSNMIFPPDLRPGGNVTFLVRQTEDGRFRVTGVTTGMTSAPPYFGAPTPSTPPPPPGAPPPAAPGPGTVSTPPVTAQPGGPPPRGKTVVGPTFMTVTGTVKALEKGVSITIVEKSGRDRTLAIAKGTAVPEDIAVGDPVTARVPLQRPFDGKTTDKVEKPKPKKTPPPSKFKEAQTPKS
jgi:hypothetical protein